MAATKQDATALTERDRRVLELTRRFRLLSRDQIMTLAPFGSVTRVNTRLAALVEAGLLARKSLPVFVGRGSAQSLYFATPKASGFVASAEADFGRTSRQIGRWELGQVEHVRLANQAVIEIMQSVGKSGGDLMSFRSEPELRQVFVDRPFVPDGWIAWTWSGARFNCFVEVDLHHEGLTAWRGKVTRYLEYADAGAHQERLGFRSFRVVVLARSERRLENLRTLAVPAGRLFLFRRIGDGEPAPSLRERVWLRAAGSEPVGLVEG